MAASRRQRPTLRHRLLPKKVFGLLFQEAVTQLAMQSPNLRQGLKHGPPFALSFEPLGKRFAI